jgi:glycerol-3-phosphate O-acyltransferase/dihydroxyacetone phosphate acyltransferase
VYRETHRQVQFLAAAKSMERKVVGFFIRLMDSSMFYSATSMACL